MESFKGSLINKKIVMIPLTEALINKKNVKNASIRCDFFICIPDYTSDKKLYKHFELQAIDMNDIDHAYILTSEEVKQVISLVGLNFCLYISKKKNITKKDMLADFKKVVNNNDEDYTTYFKEIDPTDF